MFDIVLLLAVLATLLVVVAVSQPVAVRLKVAPVVLLAVIGVAMGVASIVLLHTPACERIWARLRRLFADLPLGSETFIYVFLPLLIFEGAITGDVRRILEDAAPILMLAVVATLFWTAGSASRSGLSPACRWSSVCCSARWWRRPIRPRSSRCFATSARRASDPAGRGRGPLERRGGDRVLHGSARNHRLRPPAGLPWRRWRSFSSLSSAAPFWACLPAAPCCNSSHGPATIGWPKPR